MASQIIIAHRGASGHAPENTLLSYQRALEFGAHMIELDVHETLDGKLVCIHDSTVNRTTNGSGEVHSFTYKELSELDAGEGERIPLLEDVLKFASGKLMVNIELKVIGVEKQVLDLAEQYGMLSDVMISSFFHGSLATIRDLSELAVTAILTSKPIDKLVRYASDFKVNAINPYHQLVTPELIHDAHCSGLKVYPWTVNDTKTMNELFTIGIDGVITDFPDRAARIL
ncbi:MAG: glycerophosphodiester phosphodiesterase [Candidatus Thorarchaeota archaeon]|jgi:glycerophosphoryl diester phosphodiesterase